MLFQMVLPLDYGLMIFLEKSNHTNFLSLVEGTIVGLPHPFGKLLQGEFSLHLADWGFALFTAQVWQIVADIIYIILVVGNLGRWGLVHNPCNICFLWFRSQQESFHWEANGRSPMCTARWSRWRSRAGRWCQIAWIVFWQFWRKSQCTWRWWPLSWKLLLGKHLKLTITTLVKIISWPLWPITWKLLVYAGGWLQTVVCYIQWKIVTNLHSFSKQLLWRRVTVPMWQMILIGVLLWSTVFASGSA